jgi:hypothetical protein
MSAFHKGSKFRPQRRAGVVGASVLGDQDCEPVPFLGGLESLFERLLEVEETTEL